MRFLHIHIELLNTVQPNLRDSGGFWSFQGFRVVSGSVRKPNLPAYAAPLQAGFKTPPAVRNM